MAHRDEPNQNAPDPHDFEQRLNAKLEARRVKEAETKASGWGQGVRYGTEFAGGVLVGAGLGYLTDQFFNWTPWGLLTGVILGFAAGTLNVVRAAQSMNQSDDASS
ncbi:AtpZ/AtpI family protein [Oceanicaulis sp.]|uniref:AtpZ/AtpI family protein n=1 Tax=Oceanicaulis sp. TaxID=1924941 RepID=UPI003BAC2A61